MTPSRIAGRPWCPRLKMSGMEGRCGEDLGASRARAGSLGRLAEAIKSRCLWAIFEARASGVAS